MLQYKNNKNVHFIVVRISLKGFSLKIRNALKKFSMHSFLWKKFGRKKSSFRDVSCWSHYQMIGKIY